jgi:hypothetical protein
VRRQLFPSILVAIGVALPLLTLAQRASMAGPTVAIAGAPFQGERVGRLVLKLADGTTITREVQGRFARDSEGRVREEEQQASGSTYVVVLDPVKHMMITWSSVGNKVATTVPLAEQMRFTFPLGNSLGSAGRLGFGGTYAAPGAEPLKVTTQNLGQKTIDGVVATGTRTTTVIPKGAQGNDRDLTTVHDVWSSEDLKLTVLDSIDDPVNGLQTLEVQGITRIEPDLAVFQPPADYVEKPFAIGGGVAGGVFLPPKQ